MPLFKLSRVDNTLKDRLDVLRHAQKSKIVGVDRVYRTAILIRSAENTFSVNEINLIVALIERITERVVDYSSACERLRISSVTIRIDSRHHDIRNVGMLLAHLFVKRKVSIAKSRK